MRFLPNTPIRLYQLTSNYTPGMGTESSWAAIESLVTADIKTAVFYCEWRGGFGDRTFAAHAQGVNDFATLRMMYHPEAYKALCTKQVVISRGADGSVLINGKPDNTNGNYYELWGAVDNVLNQNRFMEFKVRRYEVK